MKGPEANKIEALFDSIALDYDRLNHILSLGIDRTWRRRALKEIVNSEKQQRILDVACGTGDFSIAIARKAAPGASVTGLDLSEGMLKVMEGMPFEDGTFDVVTIAFGIRNFEHREDALREILRVLRPGGRLVILELSIPEIPIIRGLYKLYFTKVLPLIGGAAATAASATRHSPSESAECT